MEKVAILCVTYGKRFDYVKQIVNEIKKNEIINRIILVDNNSGNDFNKLNCKKLQIISNSTNLGSAGGYKKAVEYYLKNPIEKYVLFLDDDNIIDKKTLDELLLQYKKLKTIDNEVGLLCTRKEMKKYWLIAKGKLDKEFLYSHNAFARFSIFDIFKKIKYRLLSKKNIAQHEVHNTEPIKVNIGYWSGLFLERDTLIKNDLPRDDFFLYREDHEYIYRLIENGLSLYLVPTAELIELDSNWAISSTKNIFSLPELNGDDYRAYYSIRNVVYFEEYILNDKSLMRKLNGLVYKLLLFIMSFNNKERYKLIKKAIQDGQKGKLGINEETSIG